MRRDYVSIRIHTKHWLHDYRPSTTGVARGHTKHARWEEAEKWQNSSTCTLRDTLSLSQKKQLTLRFCLFYLYDVLITAAGGLYTARKKSYGNMKMTKKNKKREEPWLASCQNTITKDERMDVELFCFLMYPWEKKTFWTHSHTLAIEIQQFNLTIEEKKETLHGSVAGN